MTFFDNTRLAMAYGARSEVVIILKLSKFVSFLEESRVAAELSLMFG